MEQEALADFLSNHWGPSIFTDECTGLEFDPDAPLLVFTDGPGYVITLLDLAGLAPVDLKAAVQEDRGLDRVESQGVREKGEYPIDLSAFKTVSATHTKEPKNSWQMSDGYLLRFSNRIRFKERTYLELWVKASRTSSGARIDYVFDETGRFLGSRKQSRRCDDWG